MACAWNILAAPSGGSGVRLLGVDAVSVNDVWAVGSQDAGGRPIVLHYDGSSWSIVASPAARGGELVAVSARARDDVWAVGDYLPAGAGVRKTLIEHYDGRTWRIVTSPNLFATGNFLKGVVAVARDDAWAVGGNGTPGARGMLLHYNGTRWVSVQTPALRGKTDLLDVDARGPGHVVAVGRLGGLSRGLPLVIQYDGKKWDRQPLVIATQNGKELSGVTDRRGIDAGAVGDQSGQAHLETLAMSSGPQGWAPVPSQNVGQGINVLRRVSALRAGGETTGFAVGYSETTAFVRRNLVEVLKAGRWVAVKTPNAGPGHNDLSDVVALGPGNAWAVGTAVFPLGSRGLLLQYAC